MDYMLILMVVSLVFTGAFFFGYPIGKIVGRRQKQREFEEKYFNHPLPECVAESSRRLKEKDILNAETIEYKTEVKN